MPDFSLAVQTAVVARLTAGVTLAPVHTAVPDGTKPPVVVVADGTWQQIGGKLSNHEQHEIVVRTFVGGTSKAALFALQNQVKDALHNQPLSSAEATLSRCTFTSGSEIRDIEENTLIGEQRFSAMASPL